MLAKSRLVLIVSLALVAPMLPAMASAPASTQERAVEPAVIAATSGNSDGITFDHSNLNDPVRMVGEPDIQIDNRGGNYVSGPGGSTTQASWFWKSEDNGIQWHLIGCPAKANCQNGGGDTEITIANNRDVFASDLQTLQCNSTFRSYDEGKTFAPGEGCFPETDRQWMGNYDPNNGPTGRRIYLAANRAEVASNCYMLVSTDNGVTYAPPNPAQNSQGSLGGPQCIGRFAVDPNNGHIFVPTSGNTPSSTPGVTPGPGRTYVSTDGGVTWQARGSSGAQGNFFAPIQMDTAGNLWQGWTTACAQPATNPCKAFISYSTDRGFHWHAPIQVNTGPGSPVGATPDLHQMLFPWITVGDPGRVALVFYGTTDAGRTGSYPGSVKALWHVFTVFSTNAMDASPTFTQVQADEHPMHRGTVCTGGFPNCLTANADRSMADFFMVDKDPDGRVFIAYNENSDLSQVTPGQYIGKPMNAVIRLRTGPSLFANKGDLLPDPRPANVAITGADLTGATLNVEGTHGLPPGNWSSDRSGDASFPVVPVKSPNHGALDIREVSLSDAGGNLTAKMRVEDLSAPSVAEAQSVGDPAWLVTWWEGKGGIGPAAMTSGPFHSHRFMKMKSTGPGQFAFECGVVSSVDAPALGAPTPKVLTYNPDAACTGAITGSVNGNEVTMSAPRSELGGLASGDKLDHVVGYGLAEHAGALSDVVDQAKTFSYIIGTPPSRQHQPDGYVQVSLDPNFGSFTTATLDPSDNTWAASLPNAPAFGYVYARQFLSKDLYTSLWDDVQAGPVAQFAYPASVTPNGNLTFAHPTMAGINGDGFEMDLRADPTTPSTMYAGVPGASSANVSWLWKTTDTGQTWKWVQASQPLTGKIQGTTPPCIGGGDTEIAVDKSHRIYFNDLSGAGGVPLEFSTGRSDDGGNSFICSSTGVPDIGVDRQWYALIGEPALNDGTQVDQNTLYLTNDTLGNGAPDCETAGNVLIMYRSPVPSAVGA
ncbi:MAG TPA: sialidase family protein, partial [Actinomycetota bacterium]